MPRPLSRWVGLVLTLVLATALPVRAETKTVARCGQGFLEEVDGYKVLHLKGTPYEMGYQQGALLKTDVNELVRFLLDVKAKELKVQVGGINLLEPPARPSNGIAATQKKYLPARFSEELHGLADGSGVDYQELIVANFIPEMFHCSGFALSGSATKDGTLYHGRILDYGCDWKLQDHAVLVVAEPDGKIPFANVTYAGFIGSITGMNAKKVSVGEMGGRGLGHWEGVPMSFLVRMALEEGKTLEDAIAVFRDHPRTCGYNYVIADGKIRPGRWHGGILGQVQRRPDGRGEQTSALAVKDAVLLSAGDRYEELTRRVQASPGKFDAEGARHLHGPAGRDEVEPAQRPLRAHHHEALDRERLQRPASRRRPQPYHEFQLSELLNHKADTSVPMREIPARPTTAAAR